MTLQIPSVVLPVVAPLGTEALTIDDLVEHTSIEFSVEYIQEKTIQIVATEVALAAVVPGPLWLWVELSPFPSTNTTGIWGYWNQPLPISIAFWGAIGGGGGAIVPTAPHIEISGLGGAAGTLAHTIILPWTIHSAWARIVVQTPVAAALPNAYWVVQARYSGKTP